MGLPHEVAAAYLYDAASAVDYLHRMHVMHRDLKVRVSEKPNLVVMVVSAAAASVAVVAAAASVGGSGLRLSLDSRRYFVVTAAIGGGARLLYSHAVRTIAKRRRC